MEGYSMFYVIAGKFIMGITREEWDERLQSIIVRKEFMNKMVMNFMEINEHVDVAETFCTESGTELDREALTRRLDVKKAMQDGAVGDAIEKVNRFYPGILDSNIRLRFDLHQQHFIELVGQRKVDEALDVAEAELVKDLLDSNSDLLSLFHLRQQEYLEFVGHENVMEAPLGLEDVELRKELERTVSLLAYQNPQDSPFVDLLDVQRRLNTARDLNTAILTFQGQEKDPWVPTLVKSVIWAEHLLDDEAEYPRISDDTSAPLVGPRVFPIVLDPDLIHTVLHLGPFPTDWGMGPLE